MSTESSESNNAKQVINSLPRKLYKKIDEKAKATRTWQVFCGILLIVILSMSYSISQIPKEIVIHSTPELRAGTTQKIDYVPPFSLYSFALYIFQQIYTAENVSQDIPNHILGFQSYMTPEFKSDILNRFNMDHAVIKDGVTQEIQEIPGASPEDKVVQLTPNKWAVFLDLKITDRLNGEVIKKVYVRYPLIVEKADYNASLNPAALKISGFYQEPQRIK